MKLKRFVALLLTLVMLSCTMPASLMEEQIEPPVEEYGASLDELTIGEEGPTTGSDPVQQDNGLVIEGEETAAISEGSAMDEVKSEPVAALEAQTYDWTITGSDKRTLDIGDTLRIVVSGAEVLSWKTSSKKIVPSVAFSGGVAEVKPVAAGKATLKASVKVGSKKKTYTVTLTVNDPYVPKSIAFDSSMKSTLPVGASIMLSDYIVLTPANAKNNLTYKVSGAGKLAKDGVTMTTTKAGTATITVTSKDNKKVKTTYKVTVQANKVTNMCAKPGKNDIAAVSGGWTLWPLSLQVNKKGGLDCQFYLLNGTGEAVIKINNMELSISSGDSKVIAEKRISSLSARVSKSSSKSIKITFAANECGDLSGLFLPDEWANGTLSFGINVGEVSLSSRKNSYPFIPTQFPNSSHEVPSSISLDKNELTLMEGNSATLNATIYPAGTLKWSSSDSNVATVINGTVTAVSTGNAIITVTSTIDEMVKTFCIVYVETKKEELPSTEELIQNNLVADILIHDTEYHELLSIPSIIDPEERTLCSKINEDLKQINVLTDEHNKAVEDLNDNIEMLSNFISDDIAFVDSSDSSVCGFGYMQIIIDDAIRNAASSNAKAKVKSISEDGSVIELDLNNTSFYVIIDGNSITYTTKAPVVLNHRVMTAPAEGGVYTAPNSDNRIVNFLSNLDWIDVTYETIQKKIADVRKTNVERLATEKDVIRYYSDLYQHHAGHLEDIDIEERLKSSTSNACKYQNIIDACDAFSKALTALSIPLQIKNLRDSYQQYSDMLEIFNHNHPTTNDISAGYQDLCQKMLRTATKGITLYVTNVIPSAVELVGSICTTVAVYGGKILPGPLKLACAAFGVKAASATIVTSIISIGLESWIKNIYLDVMDMDRRLHTVIFGIVSDKGNNSIPLQYVTVRSNTDQVITNSQGYYQIFVKPGDQSISYTLKGYKEHKESINLKPGDMREINISLENENGTIAGSVQDESGHNLSGVIVITDSGARSVTGSNGSYEIKDVPVGSVRITFKKDGYTSVTKQATVIGGKTITVNEVMTGSSGTLKGTVKDKVTGKPLPGVKVNAGSLSTTTDSNGKYELQEVPEGTVEVSFSKKDYSIFEKTTTVEGGKSVTVNVELSSAYGTITGTVKDKSTGKGLSGVSVNVGDLSTTTDSDGKYEIERVPEGTVKVSLSKKDYSSVQKTATVKNGKRITVNAELSYDSGTDTIFFGHYEQDHNLSNGKEPIEWIVLKNDGKTAMLISKYVLDCKPYNNTYAEITWETCTLRKWLNSDFIDAAFSAKEQVQLQTVTVKMDKNPIYYDDPDYPCHPGNDTQDKVFLLSIVEVNTYFASDEARLCHPTWHALYIDRLNDPCAWRLRSHGLGQTSNAFVDEDGSVYYSGSNVDNDYHGIRPVIVLQLS